MSEPEHLWQLGRENLERNYTSYLIRECDRLRAVRYNTPQWDSEVMRILFYCAEALRERSSGDCLGCGASAGSGCLCEPSTGAASSTKS